MASHVNPEPKFENGSFEEGNESEFEDVEDEYSLHDEAASFPAPCANSTFKRRPMTMSRKAGILFPCNIISRKLKAGNYSQRFNKSMRQTK